MPKERKQRGRRKKKTEEDAVVEAKVEEQPCLTDEQHDYGPEGEASANFFGLLDESEQTYFKTIDDAMIADEFPSTEERDIFVQNVYQEAEGKELKLATSPLGSKVLEQLLARSTHEQIRRLFKTFQGNFMTLIRQRYASHVCEMLFAIAATVVSSEMAQASSTVEADASDEPYVSTENLFLCMFNEVSGEIAALGADIYASHVVRDTLLVLNGSLFTFEEAKGQAKRYHGQKKYSWARPSRHMPTPSSFTEALKAVMEQLSSLPAAQLRMTASQPYSVSFIQVLVVLEASLKPEDKRPLLNSLLGDNHLEERDDYVESILREPSGSKLCETIVSSVPPAQFAKFYQTYFAGRAAKFAHNPITNFVLQKVMTTTSDKAIVEDMTKELSPILRDLVELNHIQIIQRLVEANLRCQSETQGLMDDISVAFSCDSDQNLVSKILATPVATTIEDADRPPRRSAAPSGPTYNIQGVFLVIALMNLPERQSAVIINSILETPGDELISYAKSHAAIKILTSFLTTDRTTVIQKKQLLNPFFGHFVELACDTTASHFVDTCWAGTANIKLYKDRIAQELLEKADDVRGHYYGRLVWRNWHMDQFKNKRGEWNYIVKQAGLKKASAPRQLSMIPDETHGNGNGTTDEPRPAMNAQRAAMMMDEGTKRAKKKLKRKEVVTDEVDDIFKKRKV